MTINLHVLKFLLLLQFDKFLLQSRITNADIRFFNLTLVGEVVDVSDPFINLVPKGLALSYSCRHDTDYGLFSLVSLVLNYEAVPLVLDV